MVGNSDKPVHGPYSQQAVNQDPHNLEGLKRDFIKAFTECVEPADDASQKRAILEEFKMELKRRGFCIQHPKSRERTNIAFEDGALRYWPSKEEIKDFSEVHFMPRTVAQSPFSRS